jgi:hypothetical protein
MAPNTQSDLPTKDDGVPGFDSDLQAPDEEEVVKVVRSPSKGSLTFKSAVNGKLPKDGHYVFGSHNPKVEGHWCSKFWPSPFKDDVGNEWLTAEA